MVTIARSRNPYGPFENNPANPILSNRSTDKKIQATGHADLVQANDGSWWSVFLGNRPVGYPKRHHLGRETNLAPVHWTEDGWPVIGNNGKAEVEHDAGHLPIGDPVEWVKRDNFDSYTLSDNWNFYRNPVPDSWTLTERPGWLTLKGLATTLNDQESPAFLCRRQQHLNCEISTLLDFQPTQVGEEAGLTVFMNESFHYEIAKTFKDGRPMLIFRRRVGSLIKKEYEVEYTESKVILSLKASDFLYTFTYTEPGGQPITVGQGETGMLSTEMAGGFTGVYFGIYATGNGKNAQAPAYFDYFDYYPLEDKEMNQFEMMQGMSTL